MLEYKQEKGGLSRDKNSETKFNMPSLSRPPAFLEAGAEGQPGQKRKFGMTKRTPRKRYRKDPLAPASDPIPNATEIWHMLAPLDETARQMEQKWGIERLPCLVPEEMAAKFGTAREHLDQLLADNDHGNGNLDAIAEATANLRRGWLALDKAATEAGAQTLAPICWSLMVGDKPAMIVRDEAAAIEAQKRARGAAVYTLEEVGRLMAHSLATALEGVETAKQAFPGATVSAVRPRSALAGDLDDEIPF